jgi:cyclophilin family peptidyl-prolyl cis-trans isomerase
MNVACRLCVALGGLLAAGTLHATDVAVCTDRGRAVIELADDAAPLHVASFLSYVDSGFYAGTVFHRTISARIVQGGGVDRELRGRATAAPVANESNNGLSNVRGTVAAARLQDPDSASAQFFVNLDDNSTQFDAGREPGYTVFGRVKEGIAIFDEIGRLPTEAAGPFRSDVPMPLVAIKSIARLDEAALASFPAEGREAALKDAIAAASNNPAEGLRLIGHYRAICGADDPEISLSEARMALATGDRRHALFALQELNATTDPTHPSRETATALYHEALQVVDGCAPALTPTLPDATTATMEEMVAGQARVREFVAAAEAYLTCLASVIDDEERSAEDRNTAVSEHNRTVSAMEQIAAAFNEQIRIFRARG